MSLWLIRASGNEHKCIADARVYLYWDSLNYDLSQFNSKQALSQFLQQTFRQTQPFLQKSWLRQIWSFAKLIKKKDWILLPREDEDVVCVGKVTGDYVSNPLINLPLYHYRSVDWFASDIPFENFPVDIQRLICEPVTVSLITQNDAEKRIQHMAKNNWSFQQEQVAANNDLHSPNNKPDMLYSDLEKVAHKQIKDFLRLNFKGAALARLIEAILKAQGYDILRCPQWHQHMIELLANQGSIGFGESKVYVQIKTDNNVAGQATINNLQATMQYFSANYGLLVSWFGCTNSLQGELADYYFNIKVWDAERVVSELLRNYQRMDAGIKVELPLKKVWTLNNIEDEE